MTTTDAFYELLLTNPPTQEERNAAAHAFINALGDDYSGRMSEDLALWILYGVKDVTVRTQIALGGYANEKRFNEATA